VLRWDGMEGIRGIEVCPFLAHLADPFKPTKLSFYVLQTESVICSFCCALVGSVDWRSFFCANPRGIASACIRGTHSVQND